MGRSLRLDPSWERRIEEEKKRIGEKLILSPSWEFFLEKKSKENARKGRKTNFLKSIIVSPLNWVELERKELELSKIFYNLYLTPLKIKKSYIISFFLFFSTFNQEGKKLFFSSTKPLTKRRKINFLSFLSSPILFFLCSLKLPTKIVVSKRLVEKLGLDTL